MPQKGLSAAVRAIFVSACRPNCPSVRDTGARARASYKIWCGISSHKRWSSMLALDASPPSYRWAEGREVVLSGDVREGLLSSRLYQHWVVASRRMLRRNVRYSKPLQHCLHQRQESASHLTLTRSPILTDEVAAIHPCEHAVHVELADAVLLDDMLGVSSSACSTGWSSLTTIGASISDSGEKWPVSKVASGDIRSRPYVLIHQHKGRELRVRANLETLQLYKRTNSVSAKKSTTQTRPPGTHSIRM